jgi:hypothetical protein
VRTLDVAIRESRIDLPALSRVSALVQRECAGRAALQVPSNLRLRRAATGRFARVLAGIVRDKIRTAAGPTTTKGVSHTASVYQVVRPVDIPATSARIGGTTSCLFHGHMFLHAPPDRSVR